MDEPTVPAAGDGITLEPGTPLKVYRIKDPVRFLRVGLCKVGGSWLGCKQTVLWGETAKGKRIPIDPQPDRWGWYTAHWATCPHAKFFRERNRDRRGRFAGADVVA